jgi:hypothetical protein
VESNRRPRVIPPFSSKQVAGQGLALMPLGSLFDADSQNTRRCICELTRTSVKPAAPLDAISTSTILHRNTHLSMWLKRTGFADRDVVPWGS